MKEVALSAVDDSTQKVHKFSFSEANRYLLRVGVISPSERWFLATPDGRTFYKDRSVVLR